jgi:hypothetical protein
MLLDIKNPRLQHIYNNEIEDLKRSFIDCGKILEERTFKFELLICFWVSIHLKRMEAAQYIFDQDPLIEKVMYNLKRQGRD